MIEIPSLLIFAIIWQESGNTGLDPYHTGNPYVVGDEGYAYGIMQIHKAVILDVNRVYKREFVHTDAFNPALAREIFRLYINIYATEARLGHVPTLEDVARIWNGGPNGWKKDSTLKYWHGYWEVQGVEHVYFSGVKYKYEMLVWQGATIDYEISDE